MLYAMIEDADEAITVRTAQRRSESIEPSMENLCGNRLARRLSGRDTRIFSEQVSRPSVTQDNPIKVLAADY